MYVGVIQTKHLEVSSLMLRSGKAVLCEKPLCINVKETQKLLNVARENKVFLMEVRQAFLSVCQVAMLNTCTAQ